MLEFIQNIGRFLIGKRMIIAKSQKDMEKMRAVGELIAEVRESELRAVNACGALASAVDADRGLNAGHVCGAAVAVVKTCHLNAGDHRIF